MMAESPIAREDPDAAIRTWTDRLRRLVAGSIPDLLGGDGRAIARFSDEHGVRRSIDPAVLARVFGGEPGPMPERVTPDLEWWWALCGKHPVPTPAPAGPITDRRDDQAIELWTEVELGSLHAACGVAIGRGDGALLARCMDACAWHVAELEPDNATGHAWAVHAFVLCARLSDSPEADMHAQTLLHGSMRGSGRPDRFSALLLMDAAASLEAWCGR